MAPVSRLVTLEIEGSVATVTLSSPPVNALRPEVIEELLGRVLKAQSDANVKAIVLTGAGGRFSAGFDVNLFGTPAMNRLLDQRKEVLAQWAALLENGAKPTVAAIEGTALGGGCELAMACNARICAQDAQLGLPEVRLGLLPGLGGTQRLPRLVGVEKALNLLLSGQPISADEALAVGLVNEVVASGDLLAAARRLALAIAGGTAPRRRTLQLTQRMPTSGVGFAAAVQALTDARRDLRKLRYMGQLHYELLLEAVAAGLAEGPALGLQKEGEGFRAAAATRLHRMLLGLFKQHRSLRKARGAAWLLGQLQALLGLLLLVVYVKLLIPYTWCRKLAVDFKRGFSQGYRKKEAAAGLAAARALASGSPQRGAKRRAHR